MRLSGIDPFIGYAQRADLLQGAIKLALGISRLGLILGVLPARLVRIFDERLLCPDLIRGSAFIHHSHIAVNCASAQVPPQELAWW